LTRLDADNGFAWVLLAMRRDGKPTSPPADWVPQDPEALLLPEERTPK
jgi:hypothetical protein